MSQETPTNTNESDSPTTTDNAEPQTSATETPSRPALAYPDQSASLDKIHYRPLAPLAIVGIGAAGLYTLIVIIAMLFGFINGATVFLPLWLFLLPLAACVLSVVALRQMKNAEGTLAGESVALWGIYLSVLTGLGYGAYYFATSLAVRQQAHSFLMTKDDDSGFFMHLVAGDTKQAFLLTLPWERRQNIELGDSLQNRKAWNEKINHLVGQADPKGGYDQFLDSPIVQLLILGDPETTTITSRGVENWKYERGQYQIKRTYSISTREADLTITVALQSTDSDAPGRPRKWFVKLPLQPASDQPLRPTPRGQSLQALAKHSSQYLFRFFMGLKDGKLAKTAPKDLTPWANVPVPSSLVPKKAIAEVKLFLTGKAGGERDLRLSRGDYLFPKFDQTNSNFRLTLPFAFTILQDLGAKRQMQYWVLGSMTLESIAPLKLSDSGQTDTTGISWRPLSFEIQRFLEVPTAPEKSVTPLQ
ncbi:MAG: hypothetical protein ACFCD0_09405 [Gemmataceae bacterium]